ncbi:MAG TPA: DUF6531 domain-containing protein [Microthrixaceae bacterium]|nr:DUF6531 domain-containing protein [Microthrixaceae bacterium]
MTTTSADPVDLASFVEASSRLRSPLEETLTSLVTLQSSVLANSPDYGVSSNTLPAVDETLGTMGQNERFVGKVHDALVAADVQGAGVVTVADTDVAAALAAAGITPPPGPVTVEPSALFGLPPTSGFVDDPICAANGNFVHVDHDLAFPGWSAVLDVVRTYNSLATDTVGAFGPGWTSVLDLRVRPAGDSVVWAHIADGAVVAFVDDGSGRFRSVGPRPFHVTRAADGGGWILHEGHTKQWTFDETGRFTGGVGSGAILEVERDVDGRITSLAEQRSSRRVRFSWRSDRVSTVTTDDGRAVRYRYDPAGVLVEVERPAGNLRFGVDGPLITSVTDQDGVRLALNVHDEQGRVVEQTNEMGRTTRYEYSEHGTTLVSDTVDGPRNAFTHDNRGNLTALVDGLGRSMRLTYDDRGNVTRIVDRCNAVTEYSFDDRDNLLTRTDPDGLSAAWEWDELDRLVVETHRNGERTTYAYDGEHRRPTRIVGPDGAAITVELTDTDLTRRVVDADGVATTFEHDDDGQLTSVTDALGQRTSVRYDAAGMPVEIVDAAGTVTTIVNDDAGRTIETLIGDAATRFAYTAAGRPLSGTDPVGQSWHASHGPNGKLATFVDGEGSQVAFEWDLFGNLEAVVGPDGVRYSHVYDAANNLVAAIDPEGNVASRELDGESRVVKVTDTAGREWRRQLDQLGRTVVSVAPDGGRTRYEYHFDGSVAHVVHPDGTSVSSEVDQYGRVVAVVDETRARYEFEFSPAGRPTARHWPSGRVDRWTYDAAGQMVAMERDGMTTRFELDPMGRVLAADGPAGRVELTRAASGELLASTGPRRGEHYEVDAAGRLSALIDGTGGRTELEWDRRGQLVAATDAAGSTSRLDYDARGRLASTTAPNGDVTSFDYDPIGWVSRVTDPTGATTTDRLDPTGRVTATTRVDGTEVDLTLDSMGRTVAIGSGGVVDTTFTYDQRGRLAETLRVADQVLSTFERDEIGRLRRTSSPIGSLRIDRDADGAITAWNQDGTRIGVRRDARGRIVGLDDPDLGIIERPTEDTVRRDRAGRITVDARGTTFRYDDAGRLVETLHADGGRHVYRYGDDGLLAAELDPDGETSYRRGPAGRIESVVHPDGSSTELSYDRAGRRVASRDSSGSTTTYRWDLLGRLVGLERIDADGRASSHEIVHDGLGRPVDVDGTPVLWDDALTGSPLRVGATRSLYLGGHHRTAAGWTEPPSDPWGTDPDPSPHVGFRNELTAFGLVWMGARVYDPATREFLSPDPLLAVPGRPGAAGVYSYGFLDPVNHLDPAGLQPVSIEQYDAIRQQQEQGRLGQAWEAIKDDPWGTLAMVGVAAVGVGLLFFPGTQALGVGILVGVGMSAIQGIATGTFNPRGVAVNGAFGAIPGGSSLRSAMLVGAASGAGGEVVTSVVSGQPISLESVALNTVTGMAGQSITHGINTRLAGARPAVETPAPPTDTARFVVDSAGTVTDRNAARFVVDSQGVAVDNGPRPSTQPPVMMGEDMRTRVIPAANQMGGEYYQPPPFTSDAASMAHNRYWINEQMNQGRNLIDVGPARGRPNYPEPSSPWYQMERDQVAARDYPYYTQEFQP